MESLAVMFFLFVVVTAIAAAIKAAQEKKLLESNPEAWKALKQEEAAEKARKNAAWKSGVESGFNIFNAWRK